MSALLKKYYPILAFKKAFWVMDWGDKFQTLRELAKVKCNLLLLICGEKHLLQAMVFLFLNLGKYIGSGDGFSCF